MIHLGCVSRSFQLQLEIALLQGELQTEKEQLHRQTQKLQALQQEARQREKPKHSNRLTVKLSIFVACSDISYAFVIFSVLVIHDI